MVTKEEKRAYTIDKPFFSYHMSIPERHEMEDELIIPPKPKAVKFFIKKKPKEVKEEGC